MSDEESRLVDQIHAMKTDTHVKARIIMTSEPSGVVIAECAGSSEMLPDWRNPRNARARCKLAAKVAFSVAKMVADELDRSVAQVMAAAARVVSKPEDIQ